MPEAVATRDDTVAKTDTGVDKADIGKAVVGIIYPPPELRNIVDKTASFVARNGPDFETRIKDNERGNRKFNFLKEGDPYHAYYLHKVKDFIEGKAQEPAAPQLPAVPQQLQGKQAVPAAPKKKLPVYEPIILKEPPAEPIYMLDPPSISALELDVVKLTAQFVAKNGKSFLQTLIQKEQKNYLFDFLRPQHGHFQYFTKLVEQYSKILLPETKMMENLKLECKKPSALLDKAMYKVEWLKYQERVKKKEEDDREKERVSFAQIDWHDFVVVETIDFPVDEAGDLPPPVTPDELGARLIAQERYERMKEHPEEFTGEDDDIEDDEEEDEEGEKEENDTMDVEMEVTDDEAEDEDNFKPPQLPDEVAAVDTAPIQISNVKVRKDYNPKAKSGAVPAAPSDQWVISPITGERIRADQLQEHMRVALLDPRWREQRDRALEEKKRHEDPYAPGIDVSNTLKQLAERRTDIFGKGGEETMIGKKIGEEEVKDSGAVQWDGHSSSMESAIAQAKKNVTIDEQIEAIQRSKGLLPNKDAIGPAVPSSSAPTSQPVPTLPRTGTVVPGLPQQAVLVRTTPVIVQPNPNLLAQAQLAQAQQQIAQQRIVQQAAAQQQQVQIQQQQAQIQQHMIQQQLITQQIARQQAAHQQAAHMQLAGQLLSQQAAAVAAAEEHVTKRIRLEEPALQPEDQWKARFPAGPIIVKVIMPTQDHGDIKLNGQVVPVEVTLEDTVAKIKSKVTEVIGLPAGKQKILSPSGMVLKDTNTLAYFNIPPEANLTLRIKERGGKGK